MPKTSWYQGSTVKMDGKLHIIAAIPKHHVPPMMAHARLHNRIMKVVTSLARPGFFLVGIISFRWKAENQVLVFDRVNRRAMYI